MGVQKKPGGHLYFSGLRTRSGLVTTSQRSEKSAFTISPTIFTLPARIPSEDLNGLRLTGPIVAIGRPRLVTVTVPPSSAIWFRSARHFALNSVALTT